MMIPCPSLPSVLEVYVLSGKVRVTRSHRSKSKPARERKQNGKSPRFHQFRVDSSVFSLDCCFRTLSPRRICLIGEESLQVEHPSVHAMLTFLWTLFLRFPSSHHCARNRIPFLGGLNRPLWRREDRPTFPYCGRHVFYIRESAFGIPHVREIFRGPQNWKRRRRRGGDPIAAADICAPDRRSQNSLSCLLGGRRGKTTYGVRVRGGGNIWLYTLPCYRIFRAGICLTYATKTHLISSLFIGPLYPISDPLYHEEEDVSILVSDTIGLLLLCRRAKHFLIIPSSSSPPLLLRVFSTFYCPRGRNIRGIESSSGGGGEDLKVP